MKMNSTSRRGYAYTKREYVLGRWNDTRHVVEYLSESNTFGIILKLSSRRSWGHSRNLEKIQEYAKYKHCPIFVCKVWVKYNYGYMGRVEVKTVTIIKPNQWHKLEAMMHV